MNISRSILFILSFFAGTCTFAQGFIQTYSPLGSTARDVVQTSDGGYFMAGAVEVDSLLFMQRVNATGQLVWANHLDFNEAKGIAVALADDGGFAVLTEYYADTNGYKNAVLKLNSTGAIVWSTIIDNYLLPNGLRDMVATADGGFLLAGDTRDSSITNKNWLVKLTSDGNIAWKKTYGNTFMHTSRIVALPSGNFAISGGRNGGDLALAQVNAAGDLIWQQTFVKATYQKAFDLLVTTDGQLAILGTTQNPVDGSLDLCILKSTLSGGEIWFQDFPATDTVPAFLTPLPGGFAQDNDGNYYVPFSLFGETGNLIIAKLSGNGDLVWKHELFTPGACWQIIPTTDNHLALTGDNNTNALLIKIDHEGEIYANKIRGTVFRDENLDCTKASGEPGLYHYIVEARSLTGGQFFKRTNADGTYEIRVPEGDYDLLAKAAFGPSGFYNLCDTLEVVVVGASQTIDNQDIGVELLAECPMLEVEIGNGILRRCVNSRYTVSWCNYGTQAAENASIQVTADTALQYAGSSLPLTSQNGHVYTFNIPDVAVGDCNSFYVDFLVSCAADIGDIICVEAHAFPDTSCLPPGVNWDGSEIEVTGQCANDVISFKIRNKGIAPMSETLGYVIIEDHIMYMQGNIQLDAGADTIINISDPNGACYLGKLMMLNNEVSLISRPTAVVENCITGGNLDLALQFETGENNFAVSTTCGDVVGSFDPNDKRGFPLGWTDQHLLERNQDLEYLIRFQNTGNDTAFLVVVRDTLPAATLDPGSIRPIAASHDYTWDVTGNGVASFTFNNILLPDSTTNEPASHGFIRFRIRQQPDLADGVRIENRAAIFFDYNEPVITDKYFHTVGSPIVLVTHNPTGAQLLDFQVLPNPFSREATFVLKNYTPENDVRFTLIDAMGNVVREARFSGNSFLFAANNLPMGMYFFRMQENGVLLTSGRVAISK